MRHLGQFIVSIYKTRAAIWNSVVELYEKCKRPKRRERSTTDRLSPAETELTQQLLPAELADTLAEPLSPGQFSAVPKNHIQLGLEDFREHNDDWYFLKILPDFIYLQSKLVSSVVKELLVYKYFVDLIIKSFIFNVSDKTSEDQFKDIHSLLITVLIAGVWLSGIEIFFGNLNHYFLKRQIHHTNVNGEEIGEIFTVPFVLANLLSGKNVLPRGPATLTLVVAVAYTIFSRLLGGVGSFHARSYHTHEALWFAFFAYFAPPLVTGAFTLSAVPYYFPEFDGGLAKTFGVAALPFSLSLIRAYCEFKVERVVLDSHVKDKAYYKFKIAAATAAISAFILNLMQAPVSLALVLSLYGKSCDEGKINFYAPGCFYILLFGTYSALISAIDTWCNYPDAYLAAEQTRLDRGRDGTPQWLVRPPKLENQLMPARPAASVYRALTEKRKQKFVLYALQLFMAVGDLRVIGLAIASQANVYSPAFDDFLPRLMRLDDTRSVRVGKITHAYEVLASWRPAQQELASDYIALMMQVLTLIFIKMTQDRSVPFDAAVKDVFIDLRKHDEHFTQTLAEKIGNTVPDVPLRNRISNQYTVDAPVINMQKLIKQVFNINFHNDRFFYEFLSLNNPKMARALLLLWLIAHAKGSAISSEDRRTLRIARQNMIIHVTRSAASDPVLQAALDALLHHEREGFSENDAVRALMTNASVMNIVMFDCYGASLLGYYVRGFPYESLAAEDLALEIHRRQKSAHEGVVASGVHDFIEDSLVTVGEEGNAEEPLHVGVLVQNQEANVRDCLEVILKAKSIADFTHWIEGTTLGAFIRRDSESGKFMHQEGAPLWFQLFIHRVNKIIDTRRLPEAAPDAYIRRIDSTAQRSHVKKDKQRGGRANNRVNWVEEADFLADVSLPATDADEEEWKQAVSDDEFVSGSGADDETDKAATVRQGKISTGERSDVTAPKRRARQQASSATSAGAAAGFYSMSRNSEALLGRVARDERDQVRSDASDIDDSFVGKRTVYGAPIAHRSSQLRRDLAVSNSVLDSDDNETAEQPGLFFENAHRSSGGSTDSDAPAVHRGRRSDRPVRPAPVREYRADSWGPDYPDGEIERAGHGRSDQGPKRVMPPARRGK